MKSKTIILFLGIATGFSAAAQQNVEAYKAMKPSEHGAIQKSKTRIMARGKTSAVIWSEDFSGGIPSTWQNVGYNGNLGSDPAALWEYRGPSSAPNNTTGSRGAFAGTRGPIVSPSASNGFVIFDSDYLDNGGSTTNVGGGLSPAPHLGTLITDTIDLTGHPFVELAFNSYARTFFGEFKVAVSTDGGLTFPDSVEMHSDLAVNAGTTTSAIATANISTAAGNQSDVVLSFVFDGRPGNVNGNGYYFWMIDDIEIRDLPFHELRFTDAAGAPAHDIIYNNNSSSPKEGHMEDANKVPFFFDSNVFNYGSATQNNVKLSVEIYDASSNLITTLTSAATVSLNNNDTATFADLFTSNWNPGPINDYTIVYAITSDSTTAMMGERDSITVSITDSTASLDFGGFTGGDIGTDVNLGDDGAAVASLLYYPNGARVSSFTLGLTDNTVAGGDVQLEIYDSTGIDLLNGFGSAAIVSQQYTISAAQAGADQLVTFPVRGSNGSTVDLAGGAYYFVVYMYSNAGASPILIANDPTFDQPGFSSIMYDTGDQRWWAGFLNSNAFESPYIRVNTDADFSIDELAIDFKAYPNPTAGEVTLEVSQGGTYTIELVDMLGKVVDSQEVSINGNERLTRDYSQVNKGIYLLNLIGEDATETIKLTIK